MPWNSLEIGSVSTQDGSSTSHSVAEVGRHPWRSSSPTSLLITVSVRSGCSVSKWVLTMSRDGYSTTSLGNMI